MAGREHRIGRLERIKDLFTMTNLAPIFEGHDDMLGYTPD